MHDFTPSTQKSRRCYHRVISGIKRGGDLRFLTLTSSDSAPDDIQRSWRCLHMRLVRRKLLKGYIRVPETAPDGRHHLHILFRGSYIEQALIKAMWESIHHSTIVDIRFIHNSHSPKRMAAYMAKYMCKELAGRYSWSWGWVWRGFCRDWHIYKQWWWAYMSSIPHNSFRNCIIGWDMILAGWLKVDFTLLALLLPQRSAFP